MKYLLSIILIVCLAFYFYFYTTYNQFAGDHIHEPEFCQLTLPKVFAKFGTDEGLWNYKDLDYWNVIPNAVCYGKSQSPINIDTSQVIEKVGNHEQGLEFEYLKHVHVEMLKSNIYGQYTVQTEVYTLEVEGEFSRVSVPDASGRQGKYLSKQFHLHMPSEHTIDGKHYPMEIHFVHFAEQEGCELLQNKLSVVGILVDIDDEKESNFYEIWKDAPEGSVYEDFNLVETLEIKLEEEESKFYTYSGSLTTPPCFETVNWNVLKDPIHITQDQLDHLREYFNNPSAFTDKEIDNRPVQPLNGRTVTLRSLTHLEENHEFITQTKEELKIAFEVNDIISNAGHLD